MSRTKKKTQPTANIEVAKGFRLKFTNLRKEAFPDPLITSDYLGVKVGDLMTKNTSTILQKLGDTNDKFI